MVWLRQLLLKIWVFFPTLRIWYKFRLLIVVRSTYQMAAIFAKKNGSQIQQILCILLNTIVVWKPSFFLESRCDHKIQLAEHFSDTQRHHSLPHSALMPWKSGNRRTKMVISQVFLLVSGILACCGSHHLLNIPLDCLQEARSQVQYSSRCQGLRYIMVQDAKDLVYVPWKDARVSSTVQGARTSVVDPKLLFFFFFGSGSGFGINSGFGSGSGLLDKSYKTI